VGFEQDENFEEVPEEEAGRVLRVFRAFPAGGTGAARTAQQRFAMKALSWVRGRGGLAAGDLARELQEGLGDMAWADKGWRGLAQAQALWVASGSCQKLAKALGECAQHVGEPLEREMLLVRAALQMLVTARVPTALPGRVRLCVELRAEYSKILGAQLDLQSPMMQYLDFFMKAVLKGSGPLAHVVHTNYRPLLDADPTIASWSENVIDVLEGRVRAGPGGSGGIADMMKALMGG